MPKRPTVLALVAALFFFSAARAALATPFDPATMPVLRQGSRGPAVYVLQEALDIWRAGRGLAAIARDGDFGPETRRAVVLFQWHHSLYPDGVAGPLTWRALAAATNGGRAPDAPAPGSIPGFAQGRESARQAAAWAAAAMPGRFAVVDSRANGDRPLAVYLPAGYDPGQSAKLFIYFHGHYGSVGEGFARSGLFGRIRDLAAAHPQTIFVFPQAAAPPFSYWMAPPEDFAAMESEALLLARDLLGGRWPAGVSERIVSAHSGGGLALKNAVRAGAFRANRIEFLDCTYGDWGEVVAAWAAAAPPGTISIEGWHTSGSTERNDLDLARRYPAIMTVHRSAVSHGEIPARYLGTALD
jgi:peptidoglycan hydrolase-like protein with peptidoglycan-binding domain